MLPASEFLSLETYDSIELIRNHFPALSQINKAHKFDNLENSRFFIIRTQGEDNVHKAMKYGIWTSSSRKNERLHEAFKSKTDVYLFFTEINSLCFSGMAKLTSEFDQKAHFKYWLIENKWFGTFKIQWLYVKDLHFKLFEDLKQMQKLDGSEQSLKSVYDLIDCTELNFENGNRMVQIFSKEESKTSLFEHFSQLDHLENECRIERNGSQRFDRKFKELSQVFETIPFSFSVASYERKKMQRKNQGYQPYYQNNKYGNYYQQYPQYYQQQQPYWQQNNGFYQTQYQQQYQQYQQYAGGQAQYAQQQQQMGQQGYQQPYHNQQAQQPVQPEDNSHHEEETSQDVPLHSKFVVRNKDNKKPRYDKKKKEQYVQKDVHQES